MLLTKSLPTKAKTLRLALIAVGVLAAGWVVTLLAAPEPIVGPPRVELRRATVQERRETLVRLRAAWSLRPDIINADVEKEEVRFINRVGSFGRNVRGTEIFDETCRVYASCMRDHLRRYGR